MYCTCIYILNDDANKSMSFSIIVKTTVLFVVVRIGRTLGTTMLSICSPLTTDTHHLTWEDQCEWHRMTRMTGLDCAVMCNLINKYTHIHISWPIAVIYIMAITVQCYM